MVDKQLAGVYNIPCQQRTARLTQPNIGDLHSGSAVDSDSTCGSSILSSPTRLKPSEETRVAFLFISFRTAAARPWLFKTWRVITLLLLWIFEEWRKRSVSMFESSLFKMKSHGLKTQFSLLFVHDSSKPLWVIGDFWRVTLAGGGTV